MKLNRLTEPSMMISKLKNRLGVLWFIQKHFSVLRVNYNDMIQLNKLRKCFVASSCVASNVYAAKNDTHPLNSVWTLVLTRFYSFMLKHWSFYPFNFKPWHNDL